MEEAYQPHSCISSFDYEYLDRLRICRRLRAFEARGLQRQVEKYYSQHHASSPNYPTFKRFLRTVGTLPESVARRIAPDMSQLIEWKEVSIHQADYTPSYDCRLLR